MNSSSTTGAQHDAIVELLPWYANKTLEASDQQRVQQHVSQCPECQSELALLTLTNHAIASEEIPVPSATAGLNSVLQRIQQEKSGQKSQAYTSSGTEPDNRKTVIQLAKTWFHSLAAELSIPQWTIAACAGVLAVAVVLQQSMTTTSVSDAPYTVLSSGESPVTTRFHVEFNQPVDITTARSLLSQPLENYTEAVEWSVVDNTSFALELPESSLPVTGKIELISQLLENVQQHPDVKSAEIAP
ncbi:MAG: zf-HC2 domain-containing protein [Granulosicoccus sp.]|nr:zf-HC2 domain-containing protein [Granulosicoccus sp.]